MPRYFGAMFAGFRMDRFGEIYSIYYNAFASLILKFDEQIKTNPYFLSRPKQLFRELKEIWNSADKLFWPWIQPARTPKKLKERMIFLDFNLFCAKRCIFYTWKSYTIENPRKFGGSAFFRSNFLCPAAFWPPVHQQEPPAIRITFHIESVWIVRYL